MEPLRVCSVGTAGQRQQLTLSSVLPWHSTKAQQRPQKKCPRCSQSKLDLSSLVLWASQFAFSSQFWYFHLSYSYL